MPTLAKKSEAKICPICGTTFNRKRFNGRLEDLTRYNKRITCSQSCGNSQRNPEDRTTYHFRAKKFKKPICEMCGSKEKLDAHHKDGNIKNNTPLGVEAKSYIDQGLLVPDSLTISMLFDRISQDDCKNGFMLDGFPRTIFQAEELDKALAKLETKLDVVISITISDDEIKSRVSSRRVCSSCGAGYNTEFKPTKVAGGCEAARHKRKGYKRGCAEREDEDARRMKLRCGGMRCGE